PGTGRASVDLTVYDKSLVNQANSSNWADWKLGPAFGQLGFNPPNAPFDATPHQFPMNQMPTDEEGVNNWLGTQMIYSVNPETQVRNDAFIALVKKIGEPVIWMGWSGGGSLGQELDCGGPPHTGASGQPGLRSISRTAGVLALWLKVCEPAPVAYQC